MLMNSMTATLSSSSRRESVRMQPESTFGGGQVRGAVVLECQFAVEEVDELGAGGPAWNVRSSGTWKRRQQVSEEESAERIPCQDETNFRDIKCGIWDLCPAGLSLLLMEAIS